VESVGCWPRSYAQPGRADHRRVRARRGQSDRIASGVGIVRACTCVWPRYKTPPLLVDVICAGFSLS
jgi:hypothetical protein